MVNDDQDLILVVLEWALTEHNAGKVVTDAEVANYFEISEEEAASIRQKLEEIGEL